MRMVFPNMEYKNKAIEYIKEFHDYYSEINGTGSLDYYLKESTYEEWLKKILADIDIANIKENGIPSVTYFYIREEDDKIIGMINIRLALNDFLKKEGGHIGYSIRPTERRKHYGTMMLKEALKICDIVGIKQVIITCDKINIASSNVIKNNGGVLEEEFYSEIFQEVVQRYVINR